MHASLVAIFFIFLNGGIQNWLVVRFPPTSSPCDSPLKCHVLFSNSVRHLIIVQLGCAMAEPKQNQKTVKIERILFHIKIWLGGGLGSTPNRSTCYSGTLFFTAWPSQPLCSYFRRHQSARSSIFLRQLRQR